MTWKDGEFTGEELAFRCFHCGDSERHPEKAHCSVNIYTGVYYCLRCGSSGYLGRDDMGMLTKGLKLDPKRMLERETQTENWFDIIGERVHHGPGISRYSAAERYHLKFNDGTKVDVFKSCTPDGTLVGYHIRPVNKRHIRTYGQKMFGLPRSLRRDRPMRLVEGPYDQIDPNYDACTFGFPSEAQVLALAGYTLILCPDGDVFQDYRKLRSYMKPFLYNPNVFIDAIERIPNGFDPDECKPSARERLSLEEVRKMLTPKRTFFLPAIGPAQVLESIQANQTEEEFWAVI